MSYINLGQVVWPIGSIYMSSRSTSPATIFGGTWSQLSDSKFWLPAGKYNTTGGETNHTLTINEMPKHTHTQQTGVTQVPAAMHRSTMTTDQVWSVDDGAQINSTGGGQPHNNMPPYRTCYCWIRTA